MRVRRVTAEAAGWGGTQVGPWTRHSRRIAYRNPWITVHHDEVTRPDGRPGIYGVVHYANVAVGVVAIDAEDRVALVGQHRYAFDEVTWGWCLLFSRTLRSGDRVGFEIRAITVPAALAAFAP